MNVYSFLWYIYYGDFYYFNCFPIVIVADHEIGDWGDISFTLLRFSLVWLWRRSGPGQNGNSLMWLIQIPVAVGNRLIHHTLKHTSSFFLVCINKYYFNLFSSFLMTETSPITLVTWQILGFCRLSCFAFHTCTMLGICSPPLASFFMLGKTTHKDIYFSWWQLSTVVTLIHWDNQ